MSNESSSEHLSELYRSDPDAWYRAHRAEFAAVPDFELVTDTDPAGLVVGQMAAAKAKYTRLKDPSQNKAPWAEGLAPVGGGQFGVRVRTAGTIAHAAWHELDHEGMVADWLTSAASPAEKALADMPDDARAAALAKIRARRRDR